MNAAKALVGFVLVAAVTMVLASGGIAAPPATAPAAAPAPAAAAPVVPVAPPAVPGAPVARVLVVNDLLLQDLMDVDRLAKRKMYNEAIEICQRLLDQSNLGLATTEDKGQMMSARVAANEKLSSMGPEALAVYRTLHEPQAKALYDKAIAASDPEILHEVVRRFYNTEHGLKGLSALGAFYFDRGQFVSAAYYWRRLLEVTSDQAQRAELLARLAAAYHLGGEEALARQSADELKAKYPQAKAFLGGREQNLAEFAAGVMAGPVAAGQTGRDWPGVGAIPGASRVMADCPAALNRQWTDANAATLAASQPSARSVIALGEWLRFMDRLSLEGGQVQMDSQTPVPGMIHLVSSGGLVICRDDDGVSALDAATGKPLWRQELPLVRRLKEVDDAMVPRIMRPARQIKFPAHTETVEGNKIEIPERAVDVAARWGTPFFRYGFRYFCDTWRYAATVGEDKVFVAGGFIPQSAFLDQIISQDPNLAEKVTDDSILAALSIAEEGKVLWKLGQGQGDDDVIRKGRFLGPPAYRDGRLYAVALFNGDYYLLCLSARDGTLVWKSSAVAGGAKEVVTTPGGAGEVSGPVRDWAVPPTLWGDQLFLLTTGAVSAYDIHTGDLAWAYQYPIQKARNDSPRKDAGIGRPNLNANPLIVSSQRVLCMPSDSQVVFALSAVTGRPLWLRDREGYMDLSAVDANCVLLSGFDPQERLRAPDPNVVAGLKKIEADLMKEPEKNKAILEMVRKQMEPPKQAQMGTMTLLDSATGEPLYKAPADCLIAGRPAVTAKEVIASGLGRIYRLKLADRTLTTVEVKDATAMLGNLMIVGGRLYAANACGITAYGEK